MKIEQPQPKIEKEGKENSIIKEKLNLALTKLQEIKNGLPTESKERKHAEHTLNSVKSSLENLGKNGAPQDKYSVSVEGYQGNPQESYTQNEGIPVDELIDILENYAKTAEDKEVQEINDIVAELEKNSESYFEAHYTKEHGEGGTWTKEEQNKQDLRTRYEALFISSDYRATGNEEGDYKRAMDVLKHRRELKLVGEPTPKPTVETIPKTPEPVPPTTPEKEKIPPLKLPENIPPTPESGLPLEESRDNYLKAKRLRGNVFRGKFGKLFGRTLNLGEEKMDFGGRSGELELEKVRIEYQEGLSRHRTSELKKFEDSLAERLKKGEITAENIKAEMQTKIIDLLTEEQKNIDERSVNGIEKNIFEKMKTKWRQHVWKRTGVAVALGVAAYLGTGGASVIGARAVMGGVGTYIGVESMLERWSKTLGHKSELMTQLGKFGKATKKFETTNENYKTFLAQLPPEEIKKEAARLRMLQVEKGISIDKLAVSGDNGKMAAIIIDMDNELTAKEVMSVSNTENPNLGFADILSKKLSLEVNSRNELVESEIDKERIKKMKRKTIAVLAGATTGWLVGGKLLQHHPDAATPITPPTPHEFHTVTSGENVWKIIEHDLDSHKTMAGLGSGARTYTIDALKDRFAVMPKEDLIKLGFKSGNINLINPGDTLDMSGILNTNNILQALSGAKNLTPDQISSIVSNNAKIAAWYAAHHQELSASGKIFDSSVIDKLLHGVNPLPEHSDVIPQDGAGIGDGKEILNHIDNTEQAANGSHINVIEYGDNSNTGSEYVDTSNINSDSSIVPNEYSFPTIQQHVQDVYEKNISHIFPKDPVSNWVEKGGLSASEVLKEQQPGQLTELSNYLHKLEEVTGLKPKGDSFFQSAETVHRFVNRAIQKVAELGKLEDLRL